MSELTDPPPAQLHTGAPKRRSRRKVAITPSPEPEVLAAIEPPRRAAPLSTADKTVAPVSAYFVGFLVAGSLVAALGWTKNETARHIAFAGPILATLGYAVVGGLRGWHARPGLREKFADNCYYLGFVFTQVALVFGFAPVALWGKVIQAEDVLRFFGMALGSSLIGLLCRTLFTQTVDTVSVDEEVEELAKEVTRHSKMILQEFGELSAQLGARQREAGERMRQSAEAISRTLVTYDAALATATQHLVAAEQTISETTMGLQADTAAHGQALAEAVAGAQLSLSTVQQDLEIRMREATSAVTTTSQSLSAAMALFAAMPPALQRMEETASTVERQLGGLQQTADHAQQSVERLEEALPGQVGAMLQGLQARFQATAAEQAQDFERDLTAATRELAATLRRFREQLEQVRV